jgi:hypothetical protein
MLAKHYFNSLQRIHSVCASQCSWLALRGWIRLATLAAGCTEQSAHSLQLKQMVGILC